MKKVLIPVALIVAALAGWFVWYKMHPRVEEGVIRISGNIETTTVELSFRVGGWVKARYVDEGEVLLPGRTVAMLDNAENLRDVALRTAEVRQADAALALLLAGSRPEEIAQADAAMKKAKSYWDQLVAGSRPEEIRAAEETLNAAKAESERLLTDYQRSKNLVDSGTITTQQYQAAKAAWDVAQAREREADARLKLAREGPRKEEIDQAHAAYEQAKATYDLVKAGPRKEDIDQARARLAQANETLGLSGTHLGWTTLSSPFAGEAMVLSKSTEPGEYVAPGTPIVTAADLKNVWLRGYVNETDLAKVKLGQKASVTTDSYPGKEYEGRISFISSEAEFTPKTVQTEKERVKLVFRVKIDLSNPAMELKPGMPADARIVLDK